MNRVILIVAGGTGGHVYPALAVADCLRDQGVRTVWLGSRHGLETQVVPQYGIELIRIMVSGLRGRGLLRWLIAPLALSAALVQAVAAVMRVRPGVVLGMGGFASGPGGVAAWLCRKSLVIHEQNAIPGLTNRVLSRLATRVLQAVPDSFPPNRRAVTVGNPVRDSICRVERERHEVGRSDELHVLVIGGSRGARALNVQVPAALAGSLRYLSVWHQAGHADVGATDARYSANGIDARVDPFIDAMHEAYAWADIAICRAGAITVAELAAVGLASILVPFPYAVDDHQSANARYLAAHGAAVVVPEGDQFEDRLAAAFNEIIREPQRLSSMAVRAKDLAVADAASNVAKECLELLDV